MVHLCSTIRTMAIDTDSLRPVCKAPGAGLRINLPEHEEASRSKHRPTIGVCSDFKPCGMRLFSYCAACPIARNFLKRIEEAQVRRRSGGLAWVSVLSISHASGIGTQSCRSRHHNDHSPSAARLIRASIACDQSSATSCQLRLIQLIRHWATCHCLTAPPSA